MFHVGNIHEDGGAHTCLRILIHHIMRIRVMSDISEVLQNARRDIYLAELCTQRMGKLLRIRPGTLCCTKTWERHRMDRR